jgi:hypothetical protein
MPAGSWLQICIDDEYGWLGDDQEDEKIAGAASPRQFWSAIGPWSGFAVFPKKMHPRTVIDPDPPICMK